MCLLIYHLNEAERKGEKWRREVGRLEEMIRCLDDQLTEVVAELKETVDNLIVALDRQEKDQNMVSLYVRFCVGCSHGIIQCSWSTDRLANAGEAAADRQPREQQEMHRLVYVERKHQVSRFHGDPGQPWRVE